MSGLAEALLDALAPLLPGGLLGRLVIGVLGLLLLLAGRRLFWLLLGVAGFGAGFGLARSWLPSFRLEEWQAVALAILAGLAGALLVVALQRIGVALVGVVAGGFAVLWLLGLSLERVEGLEWLLLALGAAAGGMLAALAFDLALILLSALVGAELVVAGLGATGAAGAAIFVGLVLLGVLAQAFERRRTRRRERRRERREREERRERRRREREG